MDQDNLYLKAEIKVMKIRGFYSHVLVYFLINILLFLIDFLTGGFWWFYWPLLSWGVGLVLHGIKVYALEGTFFSEEWKQKKIQEIMDKSK